MAQRARTRFEAARASTRPRWLGSPKNSSSRPNRLLSTAAPPSPPPPPRWKRWSSSSTHTRQGASDSIPPSCGGGVIELGGRGWRAIIRSMIDYLILLVTLLRAAVRSRADLVAENLLLRQQLTVLTRPTRRRPRLRTRDRLFWLLARA